MFEVSKKSAKQESFAIGIRGNSAMHLFSREGTNLFTNSKEYCDALLYDATGPHWERFAIVVGKNPYGYMPTLKLIRKYDGMAKRIMLGETVYIFDVEYVAKNVINWAEVRRTLMQLISKFAEECRNEWRNKK